MAVWSADARRLFFASDVEGRFKAYGRAADGSSPVELEFEDDGSYMPFSPINDERLLVRIRKADGDVAILHLGQPHRIEPLLAGPAQELNAQVSPDGRWIACQSDESGQFDVYVRSFPDVGRRREIVSQGGGVQPLWGPADSGELYYRSLDGAVMAAAVRTAPDLEIGARRELFPNQGYGPASPATVWFYAVSPVDGRFLMTKETTRARASPIRVVVDWLEELNALLPVL
ncbi:MAG TPA: hypothetical protein VIL43_08335 [Burkholderiales bacterium]